jgi:hypothetical protein
MLNQKITDRKSGILLYGLTPPKKEYPPDKISEIAQKQFLRIKDLNIDGLVLYDIQDEAARTDSQRPFPFLPTIDPVEYYTRYLSSLNKPIIAYNCVGKYTHDEFIRWLGQMGTLGLQYAVFVGAASKSQTVDLTIKQAYEMKKKFNEDKILGGVTIPERHIKKNDEHLRVLEKITNGCRFFISQAVYNIEASKNFLSDLNYYSNLNRKQIAPIIFTLTPCGSIKTLEFMEWLGISVPKWLKNDLMNSVDILNKSLDICYRIAEELIYFCSEKKIPIGFNIESVSIKKTEIDASVELLTRVESLLKKNFSY